jgi:hypothetical protein
LSIFASNGNSNKGNRREGVVTLENTNDFVEKLQDDQEKAEKNKKQGKGNPGQKLPNKQHSTNK